MRVNLMTPEQRRVWNLLVADVPLSEKEKAVEKPFQICNDERMAILAADQEIKTLQKILTRVTKKGIINKNS